MGWRDVQAGVASGAINYRKSPDKFGSFLEGFATTYAAGVQKKADRDYAAKLAADKLKLEELKEAKTLLQKREDEDKDNQAAAKAALEFHNIPYSDAAYQKAFTLIKGGNTSLQVGEYFKTGIEEGTIVPTQAYETVGPMPQAATATPDAFSALTGPESGGNIDALLVGMNNGKSVNFTPKKPVSQMNMEELFELQAAGGTYSKWSQANMPPGTEAYTTGDPSTPAGKYQFVGKTLRDMKGKGAFEDLKITDKTIFNEDTQDALFLWLAKDNLSRANTQAQKRQSIRNTWEGVKDPADVSDAEIDKIIASVETGVFSSDDVQTAGATGPDPLAKLKPGQSLTFELNQGYDIQKGGAGGKNDMRELSSAKKSRKLQKVTATVQADGTLTFPGWKTKDVSGMTVAEVKRDFATQKLGFGENSKFRQADDFNQAFMTGQVYLSDEKGNLLNYNTGTEQDRNIPAGMQFNVTERPFDEIDISNINTLDEYTAMDRNLQAGNKRVSQQFQTVWDNLKTTLTAADNATKIEEFLSLEFAMDPEATVEDIDNAIKIAKAKFGEEVVIPTYIATAREIIEKTPEYTETQLLEMDFAQRQLVERTHPDKNIVALAAKLNMADSGRFPTSAELSGYNDERLRKYIAGIYSDNSSGQDSNPLLNMDEATLTALNTAQAMLATQSDVNMADYLSGMASVGSAKNQRVVVQNSSELSEPQKTKLLGVIDTHIADLETLTDDLGLTKQSYFGSVKDGETVVKTEFIMRKNGQFYSPTLNKSFANNEVTDLVNVGTFNDVMGDATRLQDNTFAKMNKIRSSTFELIKRAKRLDDTVKGNKEVLTFVGGRASAILTRLGLEANTLASFLSGTTDEERMVLIRQAASAEANTDEAKTIMQKAGINAEAFANYYSQVTEFAFSYARSALGQERTTDQDFNKALQIVSAGSSYPVFSNALRGLVKMSVGNSQQMHDEYLDRAGQFYDGVNVPLNEYLGSKGLGDSVEWYNSKIATASTEASNGTTDNLSVLEAFANNTSENKFLHKRVFDQLSDAITSNSNLSGDEKASEIRLLYQSYADRLNVPVTDLQTVMGVSQ